MKVLINSINTVITIPTGSYELVDIIGYIEKKLKGTNATCSISANNNTLTCNITRNLPVNFKNENSIGKLLGFEPIILEPNKTHESSLPVNILKTNTIRIECNISAGAYNNDKSVHTIHEFFPSVPPGYKIIETPQNPIYMPINTKIIDNIFLKIVDQDGKLINLRGEVVTIRLHLKKSQE